MIKKINKSEAEWRDALIPEQFRVMREKGTEAPFSCAWRHLGEGAYHCAACGLPLFRAESKFESGTGWPSYFDPIAPDRINERGENSHGMKRTEINCARCGSHLGHVFKDGPPPTGKRYCANSISLNFKPKKE